MYNILRNGIKSQSFLLPDLWQLKWKCSFDSIFNIVIVDGRMSKKTASRNKRYLFEFYWKIFFGRRTGAMLFIDSDCVSFRIDGIWNSYCVCLCVVEIPTSSFYFSHTHTWHGFIIIVSNVWNFFHFHFFQFSSRIRKTFTSFTVSIEQWQLFSNCQNSDNNPKSKCL